MEDSLQNNWRVRVNPSKFFKDCLPQTLIGHRFARSSVKLIFEVPNLRKFLAVENPLKMMKNAFYSMLRSLFVLKIFKSLSWSCRKTAW